MKEITELGLLFLLFYTAYIDVRKMEIPNRNLFLLLICSLVSIKTVPGFSIGERLLGLLSASGILFGITCMCPGAFGGGDIKLMAVCGLFLGWRKSLLALYFAILSGGAYGAVLLASGKKRAADLIPFGPSLVFGMMLAWFWGDKILTWYWHLVKG